MEYNLFEDTPQQNFSLVSAQYLSGNEANNVTASYVPTSGSLIAGQLYGIYLYSQVFSPATNSSGGTTDYTNVTANGAFQISVVVPEPSLFPILLLAFVMIDRRMASTCRGNPLTHLGAFPP
jgi:hypothetical protein